MEPVVLKQCVKRAFICIPKVCVQSLYLESQVPSPSPPSHNHPPTHPCSIGHGGNLSYNNREQSTPFTFSMLMAEGKGAGEAL